MRNLCITLCTEQDARPLHLLSHASLICGVNLAPSSSFIAAVKARLAFSRFRVALSFEIGGCGPFGKRDREFQFNDSKLKGKDGFFLTLRYKSVSHI